MIRRVVIVDSGLRDLGGHNYSYTTMVAECLRRRGIPTRVIGARSLEAGLRQEGIEPGLSIGVGDFPIRPTLLTSLRFLGRSSRLFSNELRSLLSGELTDPEVLLFTHTLADFEVLAWSRLGSAMRCSFALLLRQTPAYREMPLWKRTLHPYFRLPPAAIRSLASAMSRRFCLLADGVALAEDLSFGVGVDCAAVPVPVDPAVLPPIAGDSNRRKRLTLGYLGEARSVKGFHLLSPLIRSVLAERDVRFLIQCPPPRSGEVEAEREIDLLKLLKAESGDRLALLDQRLTRDEYRSALGSMDVVLVPYTSERYRHATSGVFAEAAAAGKPTVVPAPSWMSVELKLRSAGVAYRRAEPGALLRAVLEAIDDYPTLSKAAVAAAPLCRGHYSPEGVIRQMFRALGEHRG